MKSGRQGRKGTSILALLVLTAILVCVGYLLSSVDFFNNSESSDNTLPGPDEEPTRTPELTQTPTPEPTDTPTPSPTSERPRLLHLLRLRYRRRLQLFSLTICRNMFRRQLRN